MAEDPRNQQSRDRQVTRNDESGRGRNENRQNASRQETQSNDTELNNERNDRVSAPVPDNYERDSE